MISRQNVLKYRDRIKDNVQSHWLTHTSVTVAANGAGLISISVPSTYDFFVTAISGKQTGVYTLAMTEVGTERRLSNNLLHSSAVIGNGNLQYPLPYPLMLRRRGGLSISVTDLSASSNVIQITLHGIAYYNEKDTQRILAKMGGLIPFFYTTDTAPISVGTSDTNSLITVAKEYDFLAIQDTYKDNNTSTGLQMKLFGSSGKTLQQADVYQDMATSLGGAQYPRKWKTPTMFFGGSSVNLITKDTSSNTLYYTLAGIAIPR